MWFGWPYLLDCVWVFRLPGQGSGRGSRAPVLGIKHTIPSRDTDRSTLRGKGEVQTDVSGNDTVLFRSLLRFKCTLLFLVRLGPSRSVASAPSWFAERTRVTSSSVGSFTGRCTQRHAHGRRRCRTSSVRGVWKFASSRFPGVG